jgi:hypothetical protein
MNIDPSEFDPVPALTPAECAEDGHQPEHYGAPTSCACECHTEQEAALQSKEQYYSQINARLREPDDVMVQALLRLRNRSARLVKLIRLGAPTIIIFNETDLVKQALDVLDPKWEEGWE